MSNETLNTILTYVVTPLLVAIVPFFIAYLNKMTEKAKSELNNNQLNAYIDIAKDAVETAVVSVTQTFVDALKKDGGFTPEAQQIAFAEAKDKAILIMGASAREALTQVYGDLDTWIDNKIQFYVKKNKVLV